jgi:hypothetical protein
MINNKHPDLRLIAIDLSSIVRRSHSAKDCKHTGDCLSEEEMLGILEKSLLSFQKKILEKEFEIANEAYKNGWTFKSYIRALSSSNLNQNDN